MLAEEVCISYCLSAGRGYHGDVTVCYDREGSTGWYAILWVATDEIMRDNKVLMHVKNAPF